MISTWPSAWPSVRRALLVLFLSGSGSVALTAALAAQQTPAGPAIHEVAAPMTVDGELADWAAVPWFSVPFRGETEAGVPAARARLAYDGRYLYLALEVHADTLVFPERSWRFGDGFYLTVLMPGGGAASASHISFGFSRVGDRLERVVVNRSGEYFPGVDVGGVLLAMSPDPEALPAAGGGPVAWGGDVVYEAAIPWPLLAPANPLADDSMALNIVTVHRGVRPERRFGMLAEDPDFDTERTPVRRGRSLPLVRQPAPRAAAVVARLARPVIALGDTADVTIAYRSAAAAASARVESPARVQVELVQAGTVVASAHMPVTAGPGVQRGVAPLSPDRAATTGPATLRVLGPGAAALESEVFLASHADLAALELELERMASDPAAAPRLRASVPAAAVRLEWIKEFVAGAPSNAPVDGVRGWWSELESLSDGLRRGEAAVPRSAGAHRVAHRSALDGSLQPYSVHLPDDFDPDRPGGYPVLVALHGSGVAERGTARVAGRAAAGMGWIVVAPKGRGVSDWYVGPAETDVMEALDHAIATLPIDPDRVHLAGFSMGGYGAWRLALRHGHRFRGVAVLAGAPCAPAPAGGECVIDLLEEAADSVPPLLVVHGVNDQAVVIDGVRRLVERAGALTDVEYRELDHAGHGGPAWWDMALDWLAARETRPPPPVRRPTALAVGDMLVFPDANSRHTYFTMHNLHAAH
jgi:predicted esterase